MTATDVLLLLAPAIALLLPLLWRRYPGEAVIERLRSTPPAPIQVLRAVTAPARLRPLARLLPRGAAVVGAHLAQRPPPLGA
jgi:hypothetical protein